MVERHTKSDVVPMEKDVKESIIKICKENSPFPVKGSKALKDIKAFLRTNGYSINNIRNFWLQPERTLGPFDELPVSFRESLANAAHFHIQEANSLTSSLLRKVALGSIFHAGAALVHQGWKVKEGYPPWIGFKFIRLGKLLILIGRKTIMIGGFLSRMCLKLFRFTAFYRAPFVHMLWKYAKVDPWNLIQDYIKKIPVDPRLSPVFKCAKRRVMSCGFVGIDLLPSNGRLYYLESNFNPGHHIERHRLFPEGDTVCIHLTNWASENGFRNIIFYPNNFAQTFDRELEKAWHEIAHRKNLRLEIIDDPRIGSPWPRRRELFMDCRADKILYVNGRALESPVTRLIARKGVLELEINRFNESAWTESEIPMPRRINSHDDVPSTDDASRFPNIIIKNAILDMTQGITLYKTKELPANASTWPNIAYEYMFPDLIVKENRGMVEEYVYIFRAYMLITPDGPVYLGARKDVSSVPVPKSLPFGPVINKIPYITNLHTGAYSVPHNEMEDRACKEAILSIGKVVFNFLEKKHILTIDQCK